MATRIIASFIIALFTCTASFAQPRDDAGSGRIVAGGKEGVGQADEGAKKPGKATGENAKRVGKATGRAVTTGARKSGKVLRRVVAKTSYADGRVGD